ncbi:MAG: copper amine oxidase N-terminal domain-containing protein [Defluviitaleaceae bacterium]|nr:copper amine oxidase N-terminal domain-containing protein [Defluviitaleaceae bacterium]
MKLYCMRVASIAFVVLIALNCTAPLLNASTQTPHIRINGETIQFAERDSQPFYHRGATFVPLRAVATALGFSVVWNEQAQTVTIEKPEHTAIIQINSNVIKVNGKNANISDPVQIINGRTVIPLNAISQITGARVRWDEASLVADIITHGEFKSEPTHAPATFSTAIHGFMLGIDPADLVRELNEREISIIPTVQDWEAISAYIDNPIDDGRRYEIGGDFPPSFSFVTEALIFKFSHDGTHQRMHAFAPFLQTSEQVGVGDSRDTVLEIYGGKFKTSATLNNTIEYFDGETYLFFVFENDIVWNWGIGLSSVFLGVDVFYF